jgi:hypothetical protein
MASVPGFLPSTSGFRFSNAFARVPLLHIDVGVAEIPIGDASNGLCGGMAFAARDYFEAKKAPPADRTPPSSGPLFDFIVDRLFDSFDLPEGVARYYELMSPVMRDDDTFLGRLIGRHGRSWVMIKQEWPRIKADIDGGHPSPLGLIKIKSVRPSDLGINHQVLAYGYDLAGSDLTINVYDPNHPGDDDVTISLSVAHPTKATRVRYSRPLGSRATGLWCFFRTDYRANRPPPAPAGKPTSAAPPE